MPNFAALEAKATAAVFVHLANVQASVGAGSAVAAIFDNGYALGQVGIGMAGTQPTLTLPTASITGEPAGQPVVVGGVSYVCAAAEPDGTGITRLLLERAA